jgi:hypothetical protein
MRLGGLCPEVGFEHLNINKNNSIRNIWSGSNAVVEPSQGQEKPLVGITLAALAGGRGPNAILMTQQPSSNIVHAAPATATAIATKGVRVGRHPASGTGTILLATGAVWWDTKIIKGQSPKGMRNEWF